MKSAASGFDSVIYDLDGVLADESKSYREAILRTVGQLLAMRGAGVRIACADIDALKKVPGFNNDWDCSFRLWKLVGKGVGRWNFAKVARPLSFAERESAEYKKAVRVFQKNYLLLRERERLLVKKSDLEKVAKAGFRQGIATGRPRGEALWFLEKEGLLGLIPPKFLVAKEDAAKEKPSPMPLLEAKKRMGVKNPVFVGDTVNDAVAAKAAGMQCIMVGKGMGGDFVVARPRDVFGVLLE